MNKNFKNKWVDFFCALIDPWILVVLVLIILLTIFVNKTMIIKDTSISNTLIYIIVTVFISILSGFAGTIIQKEIHRLNSDDSLITRGKVSIRSLKLILSNLYSFSKRIDLQRNDEKIPKLSDLDIFDRITILEEEVLSSIENWTDIIPEADIKTQIGIISKLQDQVKKIEDDKIRITEELSKQSEHNSEDNKKLQKELNQANAEIKDLEGKIYNQSSLFIGANSPFLTYKNPLESFGINNNYINELLNSKIEDNADDITLEKKKDN